MLPRIASMTKQLEAQFKSQMFDGSNLISILGLLTAFQVLYDTKCTQEGLSMWLCHFFEKKPSGDAPIACAYMSTSSKARQECVLSSYCKVVTYLLMRYSTTDNIAEADAEIDISKLTNNQNAVQYA